MADKSAGYNSIDIDLRVFRFDSPKLVPRQFLCSMAKKIPDFTSMFEKRFHYVSLGALQ
jgi:hypothetical protein